MLLFYDRALALAVLQVKELTMQRILYTLLLLMMPLVSLGPVRFARAWQGPANLLQNPGFEGDYYPWFGINEVQVAHGWTPWWRARTDADPPSTYFQPEFKQANGYIFPQRVHSGAAAQQWFTFHATHQAGMYQQVFGVAPGTRYQFTIWAQVWSSTEDDGSISVNPAYPNLQVGIDPTGNWNPWAATIVWSGAYAYYDSWGQLVVEAVAQSDVITVFMRSHPNWPVKHNDMYWDDAVLVAVGAGDVPAPPTATQPGVPVPTETPVGPAPPTPTCAPKPEDWVTYYVKRGDTLYSLATRTGTTVARVTAVNCLSTTIIEIGQPLLLPRLPPTATPIVETIPAPVPATATSAPTALPVATATSTSTEAPTASATALPTETATAPPPTDTPRAATATSTLTSTPIVAATSTATQPAATIPPPSTSTPGLPAPVATSAPSDGSTRPCGTIVVGAGFVALAGAFRFRRRRRKQ